MSAKPNHQSVVSNDQNGRPPARGMSSWLCIALSIVAASTVEAAGFGLTMPPQPLPFWIMTCGLAVLQIALAEGFRRFAPTAGQTVVSRNAWALAGTSLGCAIETTFRTLLGAPYLLDSLLLTLLRNAMISLAALSHHKAVQGQAVVIAAFVAIFSSACFGISVQTLPWCNWLLVAFTLLTVMWLISRHWEQFEMTLNATNLRRKNPWWTPALAVLLSLPFVIPIAGGRLIATEGWMPTSGGSRDSSPMARDGIGDGDLLVAGLNNIRSFAPIENAPFASSHDPTLYDVYDDTYNEPVSRKKQGRAISVEQKQPALSDDHRMAKTTKASREFSTIRKPGTRSTIRLDNIESDAVLYIRGRAPLHLKLESFDSFDGNDWSAEAPSDHSPALTLETIHDRPWLRLGVIPRRADPHAKPEVHAIKIINLNTNRVPTPNQLTGVSIDQLNRSDFFRWMQPEIVGLDRDRIPEMTTFHLQSRVVDTRKLDDLPTRKTKATARYRQFDQGNASLHIQKLAHQWVDGIPRGWPQIHAIIERLQNDYALDPDARTPRGHHSVEHFLFESKRGPDYLFASSAVWLLRSLDYPVRFVTGFYANPSRYEPRTGLTPVLSDDVHCWAEVLFENDLWVSLEPTPGYTLLAPPLTFVERVLASIQMIYHTATNRPLLTTALLAACVAILLVRRRLLDIIDCYLLTFRPYWNGRSLTFHTLSTLDRRCRRVGMPRPIAVSPRCWFEYLAMQIELQNQKTLTSGSPSSRSAEDFLSDVDRCLYGPNNPRPNQHGLPADCMEALGLWSWDNLSTIRHTNPSVAPSPLRNSYAPNQ
ncbi:MAG: transglutaminase-like domain-containing protein [Pirellulales bacterium]